METNQPLTANQKPGTNIPQVVKPMSNANKIAILFAILIILLAGIVGTIFFIPRGVNFLASVSLSSLFKGNAKIVVTPDKSQVSSGERLVLTWNGPVRTEGMYSASFPCKDGILATFHTGQSIVCDKPFFFTSPDNSFALSFTTTNKTATDVPIYLNYKDVVGNTSIVGDTIVTVVKAGTTTPKPGTVTVTSTPTTTKPVTSTTNPTTTTSKADLTIHMLDVGFIDQNNNFTPGLIVPVGNRPAVHFQVANNGGSTSGPWTLEANLPSPTTPTYFSPAEPSLAAGQSVDLTLGFNTTAQGGPVTITVNYNHAISESDYTNNVLSYRVAGSGTTTVVPTSTGKDLVAHIDAIGYMNNSQFIASTSTLSTGQRVAIKFTVSNIGTESTGAWAFTAALPSSMDASYNSTSIDGLAPGASVQFTIGFDGVKAGTNTATITLDPSNGVAESNESNNVATTTITAQ